MCKVKVADKHLIYYFLFIYSFLIMFDDHLTAPLQLCLGNFCSIIILIIILFLFLFRRDERKAPVRQLLRW